MPPRELAPVGRRAVAHLVDVVLLSAVQLAVFFAVAEKEPTSAPTGSSFGEFEPSASAQATAEITLGDDRWFLEGGAAALYIGAVLVLWTIVYGVVQGRSGRTPGKRLTGLRVVREDGTPPGTGAALLRSVLWVVDAFPYLIPWLTGFLVARGDPNRQRLGDRAARTFVVRA